MAVTSKTSKVIMYFMFNPSIDILGLN